MPMAQGNCGRPDERGNSHILLLTLILFENIMMLLNEIMKTQGNFFLNLSKKTKSANSNYTPSTIRVPIAFHMIVINTSILKKKLKVQVVITCNLGNNLNN